MTQLHLETLDLSNNPISILDLSLISNDTLSKVYRQQINPKDCFNLSTNQALKTMLVSAKHHAMFHANNICMYSPELESLSVINFALAVSAIFGTYCERLSSLYISYSELLQETDETNILSFPRLESLTMTECKTVSMNRMFLEVPTLRYLDLSKNDITSVDKHQFQFLTNLTFLNLLKIS